MSEEESLSSERSLFTYARRNDFKKLIELLDKETDVNERDDFGRTALHICATFDCLETTRELLKLSNIQVDLPDYESSWTALHRALYFKNFKIALTLIKAGAKLGDEFCGEWKSACVGAKRRDVNRSIRNISRWTPNIDHEGHTPLDLLSCSLKSLLKIAKQKMSSTSVLTFGKTDITLGIQLPSSLGDIYKPRRIDLLETQSLPSPMASLSASIDANDSIISLSASKYHSVALSRSGRVWSWVSQTHPLPTYSLQTIPTNIQYATYMTCITVRRVMVEVVD